MKTNRAIDTKLIEAYKSGDKDALSLLVKRWHLQFCKKAFWIVKDAELSKDIAQEAWQTIIYKIDELHDVSSFASWAFRIVYSKSLDALRKLSKERINLQTYSKTQNTLEDIYDEKIALKKALFKAIQNLPEQQQLVVKLFYVEDYSLKETSKTLQISIGTAKSRLFHAREKLKLILKNKKYEK